MQLLDLLACLSLAFQSSYALSQNSDLYETLSPPAAVENNIVTESNITSDPIEVVEQRAELGVTPLMQEQILSPRQPYVNNFQRQQQFHRQRVPLQSYSRPGPGGLDILNYGKGSDNRPTLDSLAQYAASQGKSVTTPEDLLDMCCQFPACYDPLYELCIDTCRKCETVYPVTSWLPCPPLLNIPDCTSPNLSYRGPLPLVCYPDIGPFGNILPLDIINTASQTFAGQTAGARGGPSGKPGQAYRQAIRQTNRKLCSDQGICHSEPSSSGSLWG